MQMRYGSKVAAIAVLWVLSLVLAVVFARRGSWSVRGSGGSVPQLIEAADGRLFVLLRNVDSSGGTIGWVLDPVDISRAK